MFAGCWSGGRTHIRGEKKAYKQTLEAAGTTCTSRLLSFKYSLKSYGVVSLHYPQLLLLQCEQGGKVQGCKKKEHHRFGRRERLADSPFSAPGAASRGCGGGSGCARTRISPRRPHGTWRGSRTQVLPSCGNRLERKYPLKHLSSSSYLCPPPLSSHHLPVHTVTILYSSFSSLRLYYSTPPCLPEPRPGPVLSQPHIIPTKTLVTYRSQNLAQLVPYH